MQILTDYNIQPHAVLPHAPSSSRACPRAAGTGLCRLSLRSLLCVPLCGLHGHGSSVRRQRLATGLANNAQRRSYRPQATAAGRPPIFTALGASGRSADQNIDQQPAARGGFGRSSAPGLPRARARLPVRCARAAATAFSLSWPSARRPTGCLPVHGCIA